jgi:carbon-monoxide dehydrogenase large subunit
MDYTMPRADDVPNYETSNMEVLGASNPLEVKGVGETGAIGSPPAVINAVLNALAPLGVTKIEMPATPLKVWQAIQAAKVPAAAE